MRTFTKIFSLLIALILFGSSNIYAQHFTDPNGDPGAPLLEVWIYGATVDGTALADGDEIAAYDGDKIVGVMTIDIPSPGTQVDEFNWINNKLVVYSKDEDGNDLYEPGHPIVFKAWDGESEDWWAYTWNEETPGNANTGHINFHNTWYAPIGDTSGFANIGAFYPEEGGYGYCYVSLGFVDTDVTNNHTINFTVNGDGDVEGAVIASAGYTGTTTVAGVASIDVPWISGTVNYVFSVTHNDYETEYVTVSVSAVGSTGVTVNLDSYGSISGNVTYTDLDGNAGLFAEGALVSVQVYDSLYSDYADADGDYIIANIPDGTYDVVASYTGCDNGTLEATIDGDGSTLQDQDFALIPVQGTVAGELFDATTLQLLTGDPLSVTLDGEEVFDVPGGGDFTVDGSGGYSLTYNAGTYDLVIDYSVDYETYTLENFVITPSTTITENFNLLPDPFVDYPYDEITGNPNTLWSIHIESAKFGASSLIPYDQIAIFDVEAGVVGSGLEVQVGTLTLDKSAIWQNSGYNVLKAYGQLNDGSTGFTEGDAIDFRGYDVSHGDGDPTGEPLSWSLNANMGTYSGTTFPDPNENEVSYLTINWDYPQGSIIGTVTDGAVAIEDVAVEVTNVFTDEVVGTDNTIADGSFVIGTDQGTYNVKFSKDGYATLTMTDITVDAGETYDMGEVVLAERGQATQSYSFAPGFHFFGRAVELSEDNMMTLLNDDGTSFEDDFTHSWVANDASEMMEYDDDDDHWIPTDGVNITYTWDLLEGYQIFIHSDDGTYAFDLEADQYLAEPEDNPIEMDAAGFYYVPYFPYDYASPDDAITAFASILEDIDWVMDQDGNRLHKDNGSWIDNIGTMDPTQGYKVKVTAATTLTYPAAASKAHRDARVMLDPVHFVYNGGNAAEWTYTMYINTNDFETGDEIAAYSNNILVGSMVIDSDNAWEDDLPTFLEAVDGGYEIGSDIELIGWDASENNEYSVIFEMEQEVGDAYMGTKYPAGLDQFSFVNVYRGTVRVDENQVNNDVKVYPNPTSTMLNVSSVSEISIVKVYNIYGALTDVIQLNSKLGSLNVENYSSGTYLIQLHTDTGIITKRVLVK